MPVVEVKIFSAHCIGPSPRIMLAPDQRPIGMRVIQKAGSDMRGHHSLQRPGLVAIFMAICLTVASMVPAQAAALPPAVQQMAAAIGKLQSYRLSEDVNAVGSSKASLFSNMHLEAVFVQKGKTQESHITMQIKFGNNWEMLLELVTNTKHSCERGPLLGMFSSSKSSTASLKKWSCSKDPKSLGMSNTNPADVIIGLSKFSFAALGPRTILGQPCDGFTIAKKTPGDSQKGSMWINRMNHLLVEMDFIETQSQGSGSKPSVNKIKVVLSNANDPTLIVPDI